MAVEMVSYDGAIGSPEIFAEVDTIGLPQDCSNASQNLSFTILIAMVPSSPIKLAAMFFASG